MWAVRFLQSLKSLNEKSRFTHYVYIAFHNNENNNFMVEGSEVTLRETFRARILGLGRLQKERQGAAFMVQLIRQLLYGDGNKPNFEGITIPKDSSVATLRKSYEALSDIVNQTFPDGSRVLFHLDEHRRVHEDKSFRKGAFEALAMLPKWRCLATCTDILSEIDPLGSSTVCRNPIPLTIVDFTKLIASHPELDIGRLWKKRSNRDKRFRRKYSTLAFRMSAKAYFEAGAMHRGQSAFLVGMADAI